MSCNRFSPLYRVLAILSLVMSAVSCGQGDGPKAVVNQSAPLAQDYVLVWSDEFNEGSAPNVKNWRIETGYGDAGWGNNEWQLYTESPDNVRVEDGNLVITALCSSADTAPEECNDGATAARTGIITSARINTKDKYEFKFGKIQARIKTPPGKGTWPAFWMLGANFPEQPWPGAGEIDIMEMHQFFSDAKTTHFTVHWCDDSVPGPVPCVVNPGWKFFSQFKTFDELLTDDFHVFEAEWNESSIVGKIDGIPYFTRAIDPDTSEEFLNRFFMILNVAVGGTLGGPPNTSTTWPQQMLVDWVRVYQKPAPDIIELIAEDPADGVKSYREIINSVIFGGDSVVADLTSKDVAPLVGETVLELDYRSANTFFSGGAFTFNRIDLTDYSKVVFSLDTSAFPDLANIAIEMNDYRFTGDGAPGKVSLPLTNYTPTVSGNWETYEIPLTDFNGVNLDSVTSWGFWNPQNASNQLIAGKLY
ncbi:MAG: glycoside hydrolase family 16 protein, partial [Gammaproteobacteria bacterium]